jgi:hypothetical protein
VLGGGLLAAGAAVAASSASQVTMGTAPLPQVVTGAATAMGSVVVEPPAPTTVAPEATGPKTRVLQGAPPMRPLQGKPGLPPAAKSPKATMGEF